MSNPIQSSFVLFEPKRLAGLARMVHATPPASFWDRTRAAKTVMVLDLGFLGDTVHLLPALWMTHRAYPQAVLHCAVAEHVRSLMQCVPWVDKVWGYARFPKHATFRQNLQMVARLRKEKFDALINLNGSDRSSWLTFLSGARERLGRLPADGGPPFWRRMYTAFVEHPFTSEPIYVQRCRCLEKSGFPSSPPEFNVKIDPVHLRAAGIAEGHDAYFHLSPFTTDDRKELPPEQLVELVNALEKRWPQKKLVISCAPNAREQEKMAWLLGKLSRQPWLVCAGTLNLVQLAAVIQASEAHLCGDTGTLHLGLMTSTPTVSWFRPNPGCTPWIPIGPHYRTLFGTGNDPHGSLTGIEVAKVLDALSEVLA